MRDFLLRAQLIHLEVERLRTEARHCRDPERLEAIRNEVDVLYGSMLEIRREQLMAEMERKRPRQKRSLWQKLTLRVRGERGSEREQEGGGQS